MITPDRGWSRGGLYRHVASLAAGYQESLHARDITISTQWVALVAAVAVGALGAGWLIAIGQATTVVLAAIVAALIVLCARAPGPFVALMILVITNGVPMINLSRGLVGSFRIQDCAVLALAAGLYWYRGEVAGRRERRVARMTSIWAACLLAWLTVTMVRTAAFDGIPVRYAASYGRDFVYFAILLPLAVRARLPSRSIYRGAALLMTGVIVFAVGRSVSTLTGYELSWLLHPNLSAEQSGLLRIYSPMTDIVNTSLIFATAWLFAGPASRRRLPAAALVTLLALSVALAFTRSNYAAMIAALLAGVAVHIILRGSFTAVLMRVAMTVVIVILIVIMVNNSTLGESGLGTIAGAIAERAQSGVSAVGNSSGTFGYRTQLDATMLHILGSQWPIGLGFLDPTVHYVSGLPQGAIRNSDVGVFNALMTIGVLGALLIYAPLLYGGLELVRTARKWRRSALLKQQWIIYGGAAWITWALVGSWNLVVLFSVSGLVITALVLGWIAQTTTRGPRMDQCN